MRIGLDLDEVVFNFIDPFLAFMAKQYGTYATRQSITQYSFESCGVIPKGTNDNVILEFAKAHGFLTTPLMQDAKVVIKALEHKGFDIHYITSRPSVDVVKEDTLIALTANGLLQHPDQIVYAKGSKAKSAVIKHIGPFLAHVDDNPAVMKDLYDNLGMIGVLFTNIEGSREVCRKEHSTSRMVSSWVETLDLITSL